jgi:hypothetical protein
MVNNFQYLPLAGVWPQLREYALGFQLLIENLRKTF